MGLRDPQPPGGEGASFPITPVTFFSVIVSNWTVPGGRCLIRIALCRLQENDDWSWNQTTKWTEDKNPNIKTIRWVTELQNYTNETDMNNGSKMKSTEHCLPLICNNNQWEQGESTYIHKSDRRKHHTVYFLCEQTN